MSDEFDDAFDRMAKGLGLHPDHRPRESAEEAIPVLVADVYEQSPAPLRARLLECLLRPLGPLALAAFAAGALGDLLQRRGHGDLPVSIDDAARFSSEQVFELARFVEDCSPDALVQIGSLLADHPLGLASVSGSILLLSIRAWRHQRSGAKR